MTVSVPSRSLAPPLVVPEPAEERVEQATRLYERFGKPLEPAYTGMFVAITPDGRTLLGSDVLDTAQRAFTAFGPGSYVFKVGEGVVGTWR